MRFNKVKAKTALLIAGKTQCEIAESLELSRRWALHSTAKRTSVKRQHAALLRLWAYPWTI